MSGIDYSRDIKKFETLVARNKWQVKCLPKWWPGVKNKPVIITEGDSWFDFPLKSITDVLGLLLKPLTGLQGFGLDEKTNVVDYLARDKKIDGLFLRLERSGDHAQELSAQQADGKNGVLEDKVPSQTLYTALQNKYVRRHLDCIVLSAGGNDMVRAVRKQVIGDYQADMHGSIDLAAMEQAAKEVADHYLQAILYRDQFTPNAKVLCHSYAYAVQVHRGTTVHINSDDIVWLSKGLKRLLDTRWLKKALAHIGIEEGEDGQFERRSSANLHETFDKKGWPLNPQNAQGEGVHPVRAQFIKLMLDTLYEAVHELPQRYQIQTGQTLQGFDYLDIREEVQAPEYWADFIHLNSEGYKVVGKKFSEKVAAMV